MKLNIIHYKKYFESYLGRLKPGGKGECSVRCPFHEDRRPSLSVNIEKGLWHCFAGCGAGGVLDFEQRKTSGSRAEAWQNVLKIVGLKSTSTSPPDTQLYDYRDEAGKLLYQVLRLPGKVFKQRRPDGDRGWIWKLKGVRRVPYRLPEILPAQRVYIAEGEKDVETLRALGLPATTNSEGAGKWREEFSDYFKGKEVVIFADNDELGRDHAERVARNLHPFARRVKVIALPGLDEKGDVSDFCAKMAEQAKKLLLAEVEHAPYWKPTPAAGDARHEPEHSIEIAKPSASEAPATPARSSCPNIPEGAWYGVAKDYREAVAASTEASDNYHLGAFLTAAGLALGRSVHFGMGSKVYPNPYVVLVGKSGGARKTTAMHLGLRLAQAARPDVHVMRSLDSAEGLIQALANVQAPRNEKECVPTVVWLAEFRSLLDKSAKEGLRNLIPTLCDAFDCPPRLEVNTRKSPVSAEEPFLSILAGTTESWLEQLSMEDVEGGLGNRIMFFPGQPKTRIPKPPDPRQPLWNSLISRLHDVHDHWRQQRNTELRLSPEAEKRWERYYCSFDDSRHDDEVISVLREREHVHCIKTASIWAALDKSPTIELPHLEASILLMDYLYHSLLHLFSGFGEGRWVKDEHRLIQAVKDAGERGISRRELQRRFHRMSAEHLHRHLRWLVGDDGELREVKVGHRIMLYYNG
jgi:hypothetical protein